MDVELVSNYEEVKNAILEKVLLLSVVKFKTNNYADAFFLGIRNCLNLIFVFINIS